MMVNRCHIVHNVVEHEASNDAFVHRAQVVRCRHGILGIIVGWRRDFHRLQESVEWLVAQEQLLPQGRVLQLGMQWSGAGRGDLGQQGLHPGVLQRVLDVG